MVRSQRLAAVIAQRSIRASFEAPYLFEDEVSDDEIIDPTSNGEVIDLTGDNEGQNPICETAFDEEVAAATPTMSNTNSIEGVQLAVPSIRDPSPAVSTALEIPATPPSEPATAASHRPWWPVAVFTEEEGRDGQDKSNRIPDSLDRSASSSCDGLGRDLPAQDEEGEPTTSPGEPPPRPQEETCLSGSYADLPSRQPDNWPSQDPFETAQSVELSEIPESSSLGVTTHHQSHLPGQVGSPELHRDLSEPFRVRATPTLASPVAKPLVY